MKSWFYWQRLVLCCHFYSNSNIFASIILPYSGTTILYLKRHILLSKLSQIWWANFQLDFPIKRMSVSRFFDLFSLKLWLNVHIFVRLLCQSSSDTGQRQSVSTNLMKFHNQLRNWLNQILFRVQGNNRFCCQLVSLRKHVEFMLTWEDACQIWHPEESESFFSKLNFYDLRLLDTFIFFGLDTSDAEV